MGRSYEQLSLRERVEIEIGVRAGLSVRAIGRGLGRSAATISRELRRNARPTKQWRGAYEGERADALAQRRRRWDARFKLARQPDLGAQIRQSLAMGHSPEQIAGRLARLHGRTIISAESIYRFIYYRSSLKDYWHRLLPRKKSRRGRLGRQGGSPVRFIRDRVPICDRPHEADDRTVPGHWEADLMAFRHNRQHLLIIHERTSRLLSVHPLASKHAPGVAHQLIGALAAIPAVLRRSLAFDNGTEFARHDLLNHQLGLATFFCDPHAPWQKGGIENAIGRMRRPLPSRTDLNSLTPAQIQSLVQRYNDTPRKCLAFQTPNEVFSDIINRVALQT